MTAKNYPISPAKIGNQDGFLMMDLFLDTLLKEAIKHPSSLVPYTEEMSKEIDDLLRDVTLQE